MQIKQMQIYLFSMNNEIFLLNLNYSQNSRKYYGIELTYSTNNKSDK